MAMICRYGGSECDGCGQCMSYGPEIVCPVCGEELFFDDYVWVDGGEVVGCYRCFDEEQQDMWPYAVEMHAEEVL